MIAILLLSILSTLLTIALVVLLVVFLIKRAKNEKLSKGVTQENNVVTKENKIGLSYKTSNKGVKTVLDDISDLFSFFQTEACRSLNTPKAKKALDKMFNEALDVVGEEMSCDDAILYINDKIEPTIKLTIAKLEEDGDIPPKQNKSFIASKIASIMVQSVKSSCINNKLDKNTITKFITEIQNAICH